MFGNTNQYNNLRDSINIFTGKLISITQQHKSNTSLYAQILDVLVQQVNADAEQSLYCFGDQCINTRGVFHDIPDMYQSHLAQARAENTLHQINYRHSSQHIRRNILCVPIPATKHVVDVLCIVARDTTSFSVEQIHFCQIAAEMIAIAILTTSLPSQALPTIPKRAVVPQSIQALSLESYKLEIRVRNALTALLDDLLKELFITDQMQAIKPSEILVEVMGYVSKSPQFFSIIIRPDNSTALHFRVREGEGRIGEVISQKTYSLAMHIQPGGVDNTHLFTTQSALTYPLFTPQGNLIGALNIESAAKDGINENTVIALQQSKYIQELATVLQQYPLDELDEDDVVSTIFDDAEAQVFTIVDPDNLGAALWQLLRIAGQIMHENDVSGGILFLNRLTHTSIPADEELAPRVHIASSMGNYVLARKEWSLTGTINTPSRSVYRTDTSLRFDPSSTEWQPIGGSLHPQVSELIVPLHSPQEKKIIGFIDLVSGKENAFNDEDEALLNRLADIIEQALLRANEIREMQIEKKLLKFTHTIFEEVNTFFIQPEVDPIDTQFPYQNKDDISLYYQMRNIDDLRSKHNAILTRILGFVRTETGGHAAQILLKHESTLYIHSHTNDPRPSGPRSWPIEKGITGAALSLDTPLNIPNVHTFQGSSHTYFEGFPGTNSEMAVSIKRGNVNLGILDVQSPQAYHFTTQHEEWLYDCSRLIGRVLTAYDTAMEIAVDEALAALSDIVDNNIMEFRDSEFDDLRSKRMQLFQTLLKTSKLLSRASRIRVLLSVNAYTFDLETGKRNFSDFDNQNGVLIEIYSTDPGNSQDLDQRKRYPFVPQFIELFQRPKKHGKEHVHHKIIWIPQHDPSLKQFFNDNTVIGRIYPIFEGAYVIGAMIFEWSQVNEANTDWFEISTIDTNEIAQQSAQMASDIITSGKLRQDELLTTKLRNFDFDILRRLTPERNKLVYTMLKNTSELTLITQGWSQIVFLTHFPGDKPMTFRRETILSVDFRNDNGRVITPLIQGNIYANHPVIASDVLKNIIGNKESWVSLDLQFTPQLDVFMQDFDSDSQIRLRGTRSLICVPLVRPVFPDRIGEETPSEQNSDSQGSLDVYAILLVGSQNPNELSDSDEHILTLYARTITTGLLNISFMQEKAQAMQEMQHDLDKVMYPLQQLLQDQQQIFIDQLPLIHDLIKLSNQILRWINTLTNEKMITYTHEDLVVAEVCTKLQQYIASYSDLFGRITAGKTLYPHFKWSIASHLPIIKGFDNTEDLIQSAVFKLIDNALKYSPDLNPEVTVESTGNYIIFRVIDNGPLIPEDEQVLLFERGFQRQSAISGTSPHGSGLGLFQVKRIARQLKGDAGYNSSTGKNVFYFSLYQSLR